MNLSYFEATIIDNWIIAKKYLIGLIKLFMLNYLQFTCQTCKKSPSFLIKLQAIVRKNDHSITFFQIQYLYQVMCCLWLNHSITLSSGLVTRSGVWCVHLVSTAPVHWSHVLATGCQWDQFLQIFWYYFVDQNIHLWM